MKVYKVEVFIIDFDELGPKEITAVIENTRYPNHCIGPEVKAIEERDIGEWSDDHPLNRRVTAQAEYGRLFASPPRKQGADFINPPIEPVVEDDLPTYLGD